RHLTNALRLVWAGIGMRKLDEVHVNVRRIRGGGNNVIRELIVLHRPLFQDDVLMERKTDALGYTPFDLAGGEKWVDHASALDDRNEICDPSHVFHSIDFDFRHVATPGVTGVRLEIGRASCRERVERCGAT